MGEVTRGTITGRDERMDTLMGEEIVQRGIIQVIEGRPIFQHLTVEENLQLGAMPYQGGRHFCRTWSAFLTISRV